MDELDARLRAMAKREDWALPAAYESAMDGLEEQIRQGGTLDRPGKRRLGKRVLSLLTISDHIFTGEAGAAGSDGGVHGFLECPGGRCSGGTGKFQLSGKRRDSRDPFGELFG